MGRSKIVLAVALGAAVSLGAEARAATCTVSDGQVLVKEQGLAGNLVAMVGFAIPVEITESTGAFRMDFTSLPQLSFSISGVNSTLTALGGAPGVGGMVEGTIDGSGNVTFPAVDVHFTTDVAPGVDLGATEPVTTGIASVALGGKDYVTEGSALDFATGALRLEGQAIIHNAPVVGETTSGVSLSCTLAPIPSQSALPKGPTLAKMHGAGKPAKPSTGTDPVGDSVTFAGKLTAGAATLDPSTVDVFVRLTLPSGDNWLLVRAPAGVLARKGNKFSATDTDGSVLHVVDGVKRAGSKAAPVSGTLTLKKSKKGFAVTLKQTGIDLSVLSASPAVTSATMTVGIGPFAASDDVAVKVGTKKTTFK
jgi:hypothetical protein